MMKKFLAIVLALALALTCFAACSKTNDDNKPTDGKTDDGN